MSGGRDWRSGNPGVDALRQFQPGGRSQGPEHPGQRGGDRPRRPVRRQRGGDGADDTEPTVLEDGDLGALIDLAKRLVARPAEDPKLAALERRLKPLIREGFSPIVFCRTSRRRSGSGGRCERCSATSGSKSSTGRCRPTNAAIASRQWPTACRRSSSPPIASPKALISRKASTRSSITTFAGTRPAINSAKGASTASAKKGRSSEVSRSTEEQSRRRRRHRGYHSQGEGHPARHRRPGRLPG